MLDILKKNMEKVNGKSLLLQYFYTHHTHLNITISLLRQDKTFSIIIKTGMISALGIVMHQYAIDQALNSEFK